MNEATRSLQVWMRLSGLFGSSLLSKFGDEPPPEWDAQIRKLSDEQLRNGLDELLKQGRAHAPSLPEFLAACRHAREFALEPPRAETPQAFDLWERASNTHFLAHVLACAAVKRTFNREQTLILCQFKRAWAEDCRADSNSEGMPIAEQKQRWQEVMAAGMRAIA